MSSQHQGSQVVIFNEDKSKVLLIKREDFRIWVPPGGRADPGETPEETAIREAFEETGYEVAVDYLIGKYRRPQFNNSLIFVYAGHIVGGDGSNRSWEALAAEWFPTDKLPKRTFRLAREVIRDAQFALDHPVQKSQYLPQWLAALFFVGIQVRNIRNRLLGR